MKLFIVMRVNFFDNSDEPIKVYSTREKAQEYINEFTTSTYYCLYKVEECDAPELSQLLKEEGFDQDKLNRIFGEK